MRDGYVSHHLQFYLDVEPRMWHAKIEGAEHSAMCSAPRGLEARLAVSLTLDTLDGPVGFINRTALRTSGVLKGNQCSKFSNPEMGSTSGISKVTTAKRSVTRRPIRQSSPRKTGLLRLSALRRQHPSTIAHSQTCIFVSVHERRDRAFSFENPPRRPSARGVDRNSVIEANRLTPNRWAGTLSARHSLAGAL